MKWIFLPALGVLFASCDRPWTQSDKQNFLGGCMSGALKDMGAAKASDYCNCMLEKVQKKYPDAADARYLKNDTAVYTMGRECMRKVKTQK